MFYISFLYLEIKTESVPECYVCDLYSRKAKLGDWLTDVPVPDKTAGTGTPYG